MSRFSRVSPGSINLRILPAAGPVSGTVIPSLNSRVDYVCGVDIPRMMRKHDLKKKWNYFF